MSREVRRVPVDWEHPKSEDNSTHYQPLHDQDFETVAKDWMANAILWSKGEHEHQNDEFAQKRNIKERFPFFWQWTDNPPDKKNYRPAWPEEIRTHLQMYETTSEGTPISPVMKTPEELAHWLADNNASAFGSMTATYEEWLPTCKDGWAPSAIVVGGILKSGVAGMSDTD